MSFTATAEIQRENVTLCEVRQKHAWSDLTGWVKGIANMQNINKSKTDDESTKTTNKEHDLRDISDIKPNIYISATHNFQLH